MIVEFVCRSESIRFRETKWEMLREYSFKVVGNKFHEKHQESLIMSAKIINSL